MRLIPGKTKVKIELFKGVSLWDVLIALVGVAMMVAVLLSSLPHRFFIILVVLFVFAALLARIDAAPNYVLLLHVMRHYTGKRYFERVLDDDMLLMLNGKKSREEILDELFGKDDEEDDNDDEEKRLTIGERKAKWQEETALRREENRILKDENASEEEKAEIRKTRVARNTAKKKANARKKADQRNNDIMDEIIPFTDIRNNQINYDGKYFGAVLEISPVEFRFFSQYRRNKSIEGGIGRILRSLNSEYSANIVKIDRPINYEEYLEREYQKADNLKRSFESGLLNEEELQARVDVLYDRLNDLEKLCYKDPVIAPYYYLVLYEHDRKQLENEIRNAQDALNYGEIGARRLNDKELALFLKYTNEIDFDEHEIDKIRPEDYATYAMPKTVEIRPRTVLVNNVETFHMRICAYPTMVDDAWLATVMSMPATKVVVKCKPMERDKAIHAIDRSLGELRGQLFTTGIDSKAMELQEHIRSLGDLIATLQQENETLLQVNIYITAYDLTATRNNPKIIQPPPSLRATYGSMKKTVRRLYHENGFRVTGMDFDQSEGFIGSQISGWDPMLNQARGIPSNSVAASYPWVFANVSDVGGICLGSSEGVPVFLDFFRRDTERVNSNMVIVGKSGSGKSYATKDILTNLAAEDAKIFILDPENEYANLAKNLHGKFINVGNAQQGRLNPFHIITAVDDDESDSAAVTGSYATHLQFLEEFFRQILPDCDKDALEYLNNLVDRMYTNFGITAETDLSVLGPEDYPIFDDLYDVILAEFQQTQNDYIRTILRSLMNYIAKFSTGGRNANIWNGPSTITTDENFTVFNFQSLLANRNGTIANAQMLLVLKYIDNEIIKNRDYNIRYKLNRKIVVAIDEAHVFIDNKFPVALDFMFQLAKRIRKYNGMQIVITQNIKDFVGSEEIARKSTAIINACQYSLVFALSPNDMQDLCTLYEKAGGINEMEQEQIMMAPRGQAFTIMGPTSRSMFRVDVPESVVEMFSSSEYKSQYFNGEEGAANWETFIGDSRERWKENRPIRREQAANAVHTMRKVTFTELTPEEAIEQKIGRDVEKIMDGTDVIQPESESDGVTEEKTSHVTFTELPEEPKAEPVSEEQPQSSRQEPTQLEKMLTQALGQFSYESIAEQIRQAVREEVQRELLNLTGQVGTATAASTVRAEAVDKPKEKEGFNFEAELEEKEDFDFDDDLKKDEDFDFDDDLEKDEDFDFDDIPEEDDDFDFDAEPEEDDTDVADKDFTDDQYTDGTDDDLDDYEMSEEEEEENVMDIFAALMKQAGSMEHSNPIEMMEVYNEKIVDISLEELASYISAKRQEKGGNANGN